MVSKTLLIIAVLLDIFTHSYGSESLIDLKIRRTSENNIAKGKTIANQDLTNGLFGFNSLPPYPVRNSKIKEPVLDAQGVIVLDIPSSKILYKKGDDERFSLASLTKIMTAIVVLENYQLDDVISVPQEATNIIGSKIMLVPDEKLTVEKLLYGLLLYSGNDAAYTLASKIGLDKFVAKMNHQAKILGLNSLEFTDPMGLDPKNSGSLRDIGFLAIYALRNPKFAQIVSTVEVEISSVDGRIKHPLKNTNRLLKNVAGVYGVKTGYTEEAGHNLISAVERNNHQILTVVLKHPSDQFAESAKLINWIFDSYSWQHT